MRCIKNQTKTKTKKPQRFSNKYGACESVRPTVTLSRHGSCHGVSWVPTFSPPYHFWNGCSTNAGSNLTKDQVMPNYPKWVERPRSSGILTKICSLKTQKEIAHRYLNIKGNHLVLELHKTSSCWPLSFFSWPLRISWYIARISTVKNKKRKKSFPPLLQYGLFAISFISTRAKKKYGTG